MNSMRLYRLLQQFVGIINKLVVDLYNGDVEPETAKTQAIAKIEETLAALKEE